MNKRTLSLAALTLLDVPPPEQVRIAARTGFTHVGLRLLPATPTDPDYDMLGDTPAVRATLAALMETGIRVSDVEIVRLTPGFTLDDRLQRFMETAARLGAGQVLVAGNDDNLQRSADNLAILAAAGRPFGLTMNLEPMPWTQLRNIAAAQALIAASGREDIGILVDALHFWRAGESLAALSARYYPTQARATGSSWMHGVGRIGAILSAFAGAEMMALNLPFESVFLIFGIPAALTVAGLAAKGIFAAGHPPVASTSPASVRGAS